ncbi:MAG: hypothetical protein H7321_01195 [Bacteroidia bacterium]|nr:hypothetical protein [Bacteroidia bacterium]
MQRYLILCFFACLPIFTKAQAPALDTAQLQVNDSLKNIFWLADSSFRAFKVGSFEALKPFFPPFRVYRKYIDTSDAGDQSNYTQFLKYQSLGYNLRSQHKKLLKSAKKTKLKLNKLTYDRAICEIDSADGFVFAYVSLIGIKTEKRKIKIGYVAVRMFYHWYMLDELKIESFSEEKKKPASAR